MMFWGITLDSGKRYTQTVEKSFHLSMAALGFQNCSSMPVTVMVEVDKAQFAVCTLQPGKIPQQPLDYCFTEGEEITFFTEGPGDVHLTGYLIEEPNVLDFEDEELSASTEESESASESSNSDDSQSSTDEMTLGDLLHGNDKMIVDNGNDNDDDDHDDEDDDDWDPSKENPKRTKKTVKIKKRKNLKNPEEHKKHSAVFEKTQSAQGKVSNPLCSGGDDDGDASDSWSPENKITPKNKIIKRQGTKKGKKHKLQGEKAESRESLSNDSMDKEVLSFKKVKRKAKKKSKVSLGEHREQALKSDNVLVKYNLSSSRQDDSTLSISNSNGTLNSPKKGSSQNVKENPATQQSSPDSSQLCEKTLPGGTKVEDIKRGKGKTAKPGQQVSVYYTGTLAKSKKQFDACLTGKPLSFTLGAGEVIRGWDIGVAGMQVGGKRRLTIPPSQGYGNERTGPIPPNSTLEFQIQLVKLS